MEMLDGVCVVVMILMAVVILYSDMQCISDIFQRKLVCKTCVHGMHIILIPPLQQTTTQQGKRENVETNGEKRVASLLVFSPVFFSFLFSQAAPLSSAPFLHKQPDQRKPLVLQLIEEQIDRRECVRATVYYISYSGFWGQNTQKYIAYAYI